MRLTVGSRALSAQPFSTVVKIMRMRDRSRAAGVNLAIFVLSTNEDAQNSNSLCCVDENLFCTHALFTVGDSKFARLTQTAVSFHFRANRTESVFFSMRNYSFFGKRNKNNLIR